MCDEFVCSDSGVGLCEDDRKLLENLGVKKPRNSDSDESARKTDEDVTDKITDNNNNAAETNRNHQTNEGRLESH